MTVSAPSQQAALVTGGGQRVGRAIALALARSGAKVAVHYFRSARGAEETCQEIRSRGGFAVPVRADLHDAAAARAAVDEAAEKLGGLTLLVGSAANFDRVPFDELDETAWHSALSLNLTANFVLARQAAPHLRASHGSMVFITCSSTLVPMRSYAAYTVSKAGLKQLMRVLALELAPEVRVNAVAPGTVLAPPDMSPEQLQRIVQRIPLAHVGTAEDVAHAVVYLAQSEFVTGHELVVDGGRSVAGLERFG